ncbi:hypothetical protein BACSTE_01412 [Bacteroides stercoris ATCC 43183]|uniref:Uncharacterized protein n=1 Tax=Bacteroides stercoris ATCC 43183 TaxID=449673 RepID=B0NPJ3_BACSE|nr:hypothetical protein BACSTE_01412 [Bacteroides stercoris ATCC 43183]
MQCLLSYNSCFPSSPALRCLKVLHLKLKYYKYLPQRYELFCFSK